MECDDSYEYTTNFLVKVRQFSNSDLHRNLLESRKFIDYMMKYKFETEYRSGGHSIVIYPNGHDLRTEGQVSLELRFHSEILGFKYPQNISFMDVSFVVSVVDSEGNKILGQSFSYSSPHLTRQPFRDLIDSYVSRRFLLAHADRLLPGDTLTLEAEAKVNLFVYHRNRDLAFEKVLSESIKEEGGTEFGEPKRYYLSLDSPLVKRLRTESKYFERMSATPMTERNSGHVSIPSEDIKALVGIAIIMFEEVPLFQFVDILDFYRLAHRYMIESVLRTCRRWLKLACRTHEDVSAILCLVELFDDPILRSIAEKRLKRIDDLGESYAVETDAEWICTPKEYPTMEGSIVTTFHFQKWWKTEEDEGEDKDVSDMSHCYV